MPLIRDGELTNDPFIELADDQPAPDGAPVIVSTARWANERGALIAHNAQIALALKNDESPEDFAVDLKYFASIVIEFPTFSDGRGFSQARQIREQFGFKGDIRARGHIIRDQYLFLHRCGVNAIEVDDEQALAEWNAAMDEFSLFYQRTVDQRAPVMSLRSRGC